MFFKYCGVSISYSLTGKGKVNVFLHGWGQNGEAFNKIANQMPKFKWLKIDFPPFGESGYVEDWSVFTYANMVISLCEHLKIKKCNLICHSFGGRVGILISSLRPELVHKLVLISSAGMKPKRGIKYYASVYKFKLLKFLGFMPQNVGSKDYQALPDQMKKMFVGIINTFLEDYCSLIQAKTLIIFGKNDDITPVYMAKRLKKLIAGSQLEIIDHAGHFCYEERPLKIIEMISRFLREEK